MMCSLFGVVKTELLAGKELHQGGPSFGIGTRALVRVMPEQVCNGAREGAPRLVAGELHCSVLNAEISAPEGGWDVDGAGCTICGWDTLCGRRALF